MDLDVVDHPLVADRLRTLRDASTGTADFRAAMDSLGTMLCFEACRGLPTTELSVETPVAPARCHTLAASPLLVPVLRAGLGLLDPAIRLLPDAGVGFVGLARDEATHEPATYLMSLPDDLSGRPVMVLDPMIATGGSLLAVLDALAARGVVAPTVVSVLATPEGLEALRGWGRDLRVVTAAVDERLDERAFIVPGLGDAGDRLYGPR